MFSFFKNLTFLFQKYASSDEKEQPNRLKIDSNTFSQSEEKSNNLVELFVDEKEIKEKKVDFKENQIELYRRIFKNYDNKIHIVKDIVKSQIKIFWEEEETKKNLAEQIDNRKKYEEADNNWLNLQLIKVEFYASLLTFLLSQNLEDIDDVIIPKKLQLQSLNSMCVKKIIIENFEKRSILIKMENDILWKGNFLFFIFYFFYILFFVYFVFGFMFFFVFFLFFVFVFFLFFFLFFFFFLNFNKLDFFLSIIYQFLLDYLSYHYLPDWKRE